MKYVNTFAGVSGKPIQLADINDQFDAINAGLDLLSADIAKTIRMPSGEPEQPVITAAQDQVVMFDPENNAITRNITQSDDRFDGIINQPNWPFFNATTGEGRSTSNTPGISYAVTGFSIFRSGHGTWTLDGFGSYLTVPRTGIYVVSAIGGSFACSVGNSFQLQIGRDSGGGMTPVMEGPVFTKAGTSAYTGWPTVFGVLPISGGDEISVLFKDLDGDNGAVVGSVEWTVWGLTQ